MANAAKHKDPGFIRARSIIIPAAYADPGTRCRRCGMTLAERQTMTGKRITWDLGHPAPYAPEHSDCNRSAGAAVGNRNRYGNALGL